MVVVGPFECYGRLLVGTNRPVEMSKKLHQFQLIWWTNLSWCRVKGGNIRRVMGVHTVTSRCRLETNTISCNVILQNVEGGNGGGAQPACPPCRDRWLLRRFPLHLNRNKTVLGLFSLLGIYFLIHSRPAISLPVWKSSMTFHSMARAIQKRIVLFLFLVSEIQTFWLRDRERKRSKK